MVFIRRKGMAIVEFPKGILIVAGRRKKFTLPGGGAERLESRKKAAIRELYEETNLKIKKIKYLFRHLGDIHLKRGKETRNNSKIFLAETYGNLRPKNEIKYIDFWKAGCKLDVADSTERIIKRYLRDYRK